MEELVINCSQLSVVGLSELAKLRSLKKIKFTYSSLFLLMHTDPVDENVKLLRALNPQLHIEVEYKSDYHDLLFYCLMIDFPS